MNFFSYDGIIAQIIRFIVQLFLLNVCYVLCCLPVFTAGAATTAIYGVFLNQQEDERLVRAFFRNFRDEFKQSTKMWLCCLAVIAVLAADFYCLFAFDFVGELVALFVSLAAAVICLSIATFFFPLQAHYRNSFRRTVRNAVVLGLGMLPVSLILMAIALMPLIIFILSIDVFQDVVIWWLPFWSALSILINSKILGFVFRKIQPEADNNETGR